LKSTGNFVDIYGKKRQAGDTWLVTSRDSEVHIVDIFEKILGNIEMTYLTNRQYAIIQNPINEGKKIFFFLYLFILYYYFIIIIIYNCYILYYNYYILLYN
jgi:hypothetical protein